MRPTLSPSARVSELPAVEVRLAALPNSPGKAAGGGDAAGTGGSALRAADRETPRDSPDRAGDSTSSDSPATAGGTDWDLAGGADLAFTGGAVLGLTGSGSASVLKAGVTGPGGTSGGSASIGCAPAGATGLEITALIAGGSFTAGCKGPVGIAGPLAARSSMISRLGLASCDVLTSTGPFRSSTTRVMPGLVSATRTRCTSLSSIALDQIRFASMRGRAFRISK